MNHLVPVAAILAVTPVLSLAQQTTPSANTQLPAIEVRASDAGNPPFPVTTSITGINDVPLKDIPAAITVLTQDQILDTQARVMSDMARQDTSITENYAPVGYYENLAIRGFALDLSGSYKINGMTMVGEQNFALENKDSVDIQKGLSGLNNGVVTPGGVVNFTTKKPDDVRSVFLGTNTEGGRYLAADIGTIFGDMDQYGLRVNAAHEDIHSHVNGADGQRDFASLSAFWKLSQDVLLQLDTDYQQKKQYSVSGYQLLGGTALPSGIDRKKLIGKQPWMPPVKVNSQNTILRLDARIAADWHASVAASHSRSVIDDNVAFAYGSDYGTTYSHYFAANGDYDIYDFRSPNDDRKTDQLTLALNGSVHTGSIRHALDVSVSTLRRQVDKSDGLYEYIGTGNIYQPTPVLSPSTEPIPASYLNLDTRQRTIHISDAMQLTPQWKVIAGGNYVWLHDRNFASDGTVSRNTQTQHFLPQLAVMWQPTPRTTLYTSYAKSLLFSAQTPLWVSNASIFLPPTVAYQTEIGVRHELTPATEISAALFRMKKPYAYPQPDGSGKFAFTQQGEQVHDGLELALRGRVTRNLHINSGITFLRARTNDTGVASYDGQQAINAPRMRAAIHADYQLPQVTGLHVLGSWIYSASKPATRDGSVSVPAYHVFHTGLRYETMVGKNKATIRLMVDNVFNKFYWKDVGESIGDGYLHPGAPRTARLTLQYDF